MKNDWVDAEADRFIKTQSREGDEVEALLAYTTRLLGTCPELAMHGGGNTSLKGKFKTLAGDEVEALWIKASGVAMETASPSDFLPLDLAYLRKLRPLPSLADGRMADEFRTRMLKPAAALPSVETLMHAFLEPACIVHTHPAAILALTNRVGGEATVAAALGKEVGVIPYADAGLALGRAVADLFDRGNGLQAIVVMHHGLIVWGRDPKEAYSRTLERVSRAELYLRDSRKHFCVSTGAADLGTARRRYREIAPLLRGLLSPASGEPDHPYRPMLLAPLISREILDLLDATGSESLACTAPLTPDYLVRTKAYPLFIENPTYGNTDLLREQLVRGITAFSDRYGAYRQRFAARLPEFDGDRFDPLPRVLLLPGLGAVCCGPDLAAARVCRDITEQALLVKQTISETGGTYLGLAEEHLFDMEFRAFQTAKVAAKESAPLRGRVAVVTGAAGAIGSAICEKLLQQGCHVAVTDLAGEDLEEISRSLKETHGDRALALPLDVTDGDSVAAAFEKTVEAFGGIDIVVINAGLAHVSSLMEMEMASFQRLERVNVEGALRMLAQAGKVFKRQGIGGDIVLISTKNVFAPGAKFAAYSATKAAAHQLCRIASLEFAEMGVRVNMVSPDAVFSHGSKRSGLWAEVGPDRMKARGLDGQGLEEYYRQRNLLKTRVTADHVAQAVVFFVTHQTPTTGATLPVDGGLPDAVPR